MIDYQPNVIEEHARHLYRRATAIILAYALAGFMGGGVAGYALLDETGTALMVALFSCLIGVAAGQARSFQLRLEAQLALCQMRIEQHTLHLARSQQPQAWPGHSAAQPSAPPVG